MKSKPGTTHPTARSEAKPRRAARRLDSMPAIPTGARSANAAPGGSPPPIGNRAYGRLRAAARDAAPAGRRDSLEALWHEASRTGSRATATRLAARAVTGARAGGLPHADRITAATGGKVDGRQFEATTTPGLPALGVTYGGRIAVRPDAPPSVAFHEAAHALGADERTADRAERDPSILGKLGKGAPVDGWKIGFELQTVGAKNMKVLKIDSTRVDPVGAVSVVYPDTRHGEPLKVKGVAAPTKGGATELDMGDVEVKTGAYEESRAGRKALRKDVEELVAWVGKVKAKGAANKQYVAAYPHSKAYYARQKAAHDPAEGPYQEPRDPYPEYIAAAPGKVDGDNVLVINFSHIAASMQTTMGVPLDKVADLARRQATADWAVRFESSDTGDVTDLSLGFRGSKTKAVKDEIQGNVTALQNAVDKWITTEEETGGEFVRLKGLLFLLAMTFGKAQWRSASGKLATLTKDTISLMHRTGLGAAYGLLTAKERTAFDTIKADPSAVFGDTYEGTAKIDEGAAAKWTFDYVVTELAEGRDALAELEGYSQVGVLDKDRTEVERQLATLAADHADRKRWAFRKQDLDHFHVDSPTEIGKGWESDTVRTDGMIIEARLAGRSKDTPLAKWTEVTDAYFRALVYINNGIVLGKDLDDVGTVPSPD